MYLTITYDNLKITCKCELYDNSIEVEEMDCPDHDSAVSEFVCDRYEKDQQFAMCIQDKLHTAYREECITRAGDVWEAQQEMLAVGGGR
jgi:homoserine kinase